MLGFRMEEISELIDNVNIITRVNCVLYDKDFHILHNSKDSMCRFCSKVREDEACRRRCLESDMRGFTEALKKKGPYRYRCHMGLTETVTPILYEDMVVGFMMVGQNLLREDAERVRANVAACADARRREALLHELSQMRYTTDAELCAMTKVVEMCVSYLYMKKLIRIKETPLPLLLKQYIETHLSEPLDVKSLCREFNMSKSGLYLLSREALGQGVTEYVRERRMERAKELLVETAASVSDVADLVGYGDTNYFTKVFKKHTSFTPSAWRREAQRTKK
jgi:AraC-like DNA-binding protein